MKYISSFIVLAVLAGGASAATTDTWLRVDGDQQGVIFWTGASAGDWCHDVIYYPSTSWLEADFGRLYHAPGGNDLMPMVGLLYDPVVGRLNSYVPQCFWFSTSGKHYSELWAFFYLRATDAISTTHWLLFEERYQIADDIRIGPQVEWFHDYTAKKDTGKYLGLGIRVPYGPKCTLDLSVSKDLDNDRAAARATFIGYIN